MVEGEHAPKGQQPILVAAEVEVAVATRNAEARAGTNSALVGARQPTSHLVEKA